MNNQKGFIMLFIVILVLVLIVGAFYFSKMNKENKSETLVITDNDDGSDERMMEDGSYDIKRNPPSANITTDGSFAGRYENYSPEMVSNAKNDKIVLFFRASWCTTCRALDKDIKDNVLKITDDLIILDVDYDKYSDLKKKYGVTYQHTLVQVDKNGEMIKKWSGSPTLSELIKEIKQ